TPARSLAGMHTLLEDCWSRAEVDTLRDRLACAPTLVARVDLFETMLSARLPAARALHPVVAHALPRLTHTGVRELVRETGYSHRGFNNLFAAAVGLSPKLFARVRRFEAALERIHRVGNGSLAALALAAGYSDQAHFTRDFRVFTGLTPGGYRALAPRHAFHVPLF
ncbi:MAG TPA: helix-turn-helix domain-containing protein, partial [Polyangiales bacterium]